MFDCPYRYITRVSCVCFVTWSGCKQTRSDSIRADAFICTIKNTSVNFLPCYINWSVLLLFTFTDFGALITFSRRCHQIKDAMRKSSVIIRGRTMSMASHVVSLVGPQWEAGYATRSLNTSVRLKCFRICEVMITGPVSQIFVISVNSTHCLNIKFYLTLFLHCSTSDHIIEKQFWDNLSHYT